jgi:iron complex outermembrane receptor protein
MAPWWMLAALSAAPCDASVSGRVVDESTGSAVPRAQVKSGEVEVTTDDAGAFVLEGLCPGNVSLTASRADYASRSRTVAVPSKTGVDFVLRPREVDVLDDVIVVAPAPKKLDTTASDALSDEELDDLRGQGLADALSSISGVTVLRGPAGGMGKPIIRGQVGRRNLILYDRVRHESQKWGLEHAPEIDPYGADRITVVKGAGGIRYGPDAIGGVVLIDPPPLPTEPSVSGEVHLVGTTNERRGTVATRVQGAHRFLPGFAWRVEGNVSRGGSAVTPDYPLDNTGSRIWNAGGSLGYQRRGFSLQASYRHHAMKAGLFSGLRAETADEFEASLGLGRPSGAEFFRRDYEIERAFQEVSHDLAIVRGRAPLGKAGDLVATYAFQENDRDEYDIVRQNVTGPQIELDLRTHTADLVFEQSPVSLGAAALLEGEVGGQFVDRRNRYDGTDPSFLPDYDEESWGVFMVERVVWERVELEGGARYDGLRRRSVLDDRTFLPFRAQDRLPSDCSETDEGAVCRTPFHAASGSLGVAVRPVAEVPEFVTSLDLSTAVRFPNTDEQFIKGAAPSFPVFSNGDGTLGPERTWTAGLTLSYANDWVYAEGSGYTSFIEDYIYFRFQPQQDEDRNAPNYSDCAPLQCGVQGAFPLYSPTAIDALFYGGELEGAIQPPKWPVRFDAQAAWVRAQQIPGGEALVFIPPAHYDLGVTYYWPDLGSSEDGHIGVPGLVRRSAAQVRPGGRLCSAAAGICAPRSRGRHCGPAGRSTPRVLADGPQSHQRALPRLHQPTPVLRQRARVGLDASRLTRLCDRSQSAVIPSQRRTVGLAMDIVRRGSARVGDCVWKRRGVPLRRRRCVRRRRRGWALRGERRVLVSRRGVRLGPALWPTGACRTRRRLR